MEEITMSSPIGWYRQDIAIKEMAKTGKALKSQTSLADYAALYQPYWPQQTLTLYPPC